VSVDEEMEEQEEDTRRPVNGETDALSRGGWNFIRSYARDDYELQSPARREIHVPLRGISSSSAPIHPVAKHTTNHFKQFDTSIQRGEFGNSNLNMQSTIEFASAPYKMDDHLWHALDKKTWGF
jgi:hypothetical protein